MEPVRLTRRGKRVVNIALLTLIVLAGWLLHITTPEECRVPIEDAPRHCHELLK